MRRPALLSCRLPGKPEAPCCSRITASLQAELADALGLSAPPIAISFVERGPEGIERYAASAPEPTPDGRTGAVPAGCVFWIKAADRTFATLAEDHGNCSVGCVTHGLKTLDEVAMSVGCMLSRVRTGMPNNEVTCAIPGHLVPEVIERLHAARAAHLAVAAYAAGAPLRGCRVLARSCAGLAAPSSITTERPAIEVGSCRTIMHPVRQAGGA
jgi:uncharacterized protein (DUF169 family)